MSGLHRLRYLAHCQAGYYRGGPAVSLMLLVER